MKKEKGITLLALAITIIVLIILTAVTINGLTGEEGILTSTNTATKNYTIAEYKEKLEESVQQTIIEKAVLGEEATLDSLRENIASIDTSMQTITMGDSINDVIVKTEEGYLYQVYFDELLGEYHVEYMGNADTSYIPKVTYTESAGTIEVNATSGNISKMTISLNGTELNSTDTNTLTYTATTSGTYVVTIETTEGLTRYAYINVTFAKDNIYAPTITAVAIDSSEATNGWYKTSVYLTIDGTSTNGTTLKYKLTGATTQGETPITDLSSKAELTISNTGLTKAISWVEYEENGTTYKSDYSYYNIKIDNVSPVIDVDSITISGTEGSNSWYTSDVVISFSSAITDANSGIAGYYYYKEGDETNKSELIDINRTLTISTDGEISLVIQGVDKAGNESTKSTIEIKKDSTAPQDFMPTITTSGTTGFTIVCGTVDLTSGIDYYEYYVGSIKVGSNDTGTLEVTDYSISDLYTIYAVAVDKAGNSKISSSTTTYSASSTSGSTSSGGSTSTGTLYTWDVYSVTSTVAYSVVENNSQDTMILGFMGRGAANNSYLNAYVTTGISQNSYFDLSNWFNDITLINGNGFNAEATSSAQAYAANCLNTKIKNCLVVVQKTSAGYISSTSGNIIIKFVKFVSSMPYLNDWTEAYNVCAYFNICYNYLYQLTETQTTNATQGTTLLGTATSYDSTAYPTDGFYNGYWYVLQT